MKACNHVNNRTVNEAVELLKNNRVRTRLIAGGTDLLSTMTEISQGFDKGLL